MPNNGKKRCRASVSGGATSSSTGLKRELSPKEQKKLEYVEQWNYFSGRYPWNGDPGVCEGALNLEVAFDYFKLVLKGTLKSYYKGHKEEKKNSRKTRIILLVS